METATAPRFAVRPDAGQAGLVALLLALAAVGWAITDERMAGMDHGPGTHPGSFGFYVTAWVVMMAAMMFPSILPVVTIYRRVQRRQQARGRASRGATAVFTGGYLVSWTAFGLLAYGLYVLARSLDVGALAWDEGGPYAAGGVLLAAAAYQLTPLKHACLSRCRGPLAFVMSNWRKGRTGALVMGITHGGWCVGCCWALMAALFALGLMSLGWMVFIAALVAIEKLLPWQVVANRLVAVTLLVLGLAVAFVPDDVPGLTIPPQADGAMGPGMDRMGSAD